MLVFYMFLSFICVILADFTTIFDSSISQTYIKYFHPMGLRMCSDECEKLHDCNSIVFHRTTLECYLYDVNCSSADILSTSGSTIGCVSQVLYRSVAKLSNKCKWYTYFYWNKTKIKRGGLLIFFFYMCVLIWKKRYF